MENNDLTVPDSAASSSSAPSTVAPRRRRTVGMGVAAGVLSLVAVAGVSAWGVSAANAGPLNASASTAQTAAHAAAATSTTAKKAHHVRGSVGTITAIDGTTWTIDTHAGTAVTVTVNGDTAYGKKGAPIAASDFSVGERIVVVGARSGDAVTATRILHLPARGHATKRPASAHAS